MIIIRVLAVWHIEAICHNRHSPRGLVKPPHLLWHSRWWPEVLHIAVCRVCEVDLSIAGVDGDVVERVELTPKEVVKDYYECRLTYVNNSNCW